MLDNSSDTIHVALAFCDPRGTYSRHAAVTMASIFANTKRPVRVHILHDETLTEDNRAKLSQLAAGFRQAVEFHDVSALMAGASIDETGLTREGARGTLFRLVMPQAVEANRIIYLDCDIVVNRDIGDLWDVDLQGKAIAAVPDVWSLDYRKNGKPLRWRHDALWSLLGVERGEYFNAGVLLMDQKKIRERYDFPAAVAGFYRAYGKCITMADQDCLNCVFADDKILIDEKFNRIDTQGVTEQDAGGTIWHMAGAKPWETLSRPHVDELYWHYLRMTPYCQSEEELIRLMLQGLSSYGCVHRHSSDCVKRLKKQMADNIFRAHLWTVPHILYQRLKKKRSR